MQQGVFVRADIASAVAINRVRERAPQKGQHIRFGQGLKLKDARAADQGFDDVEVGVLGGRANQGEQAGFHMREQGVLLGFVPAVHFIHKQDSALAVQPAALRGVFDDFPQVGHACQHRAQADELRLGKLRDNLRDGGFAGAGRAIKDDGRKQAVGLDGTAQKRAGPDDMVLTDDIVQRFGAHAGCQGRVLGKLVGKGLVK